MKSIYNSCWYRIGSISISANTQGCNIGIVLEVKKLYQDIPKCYYPTTCSMYLVTVISGRSLVNKKNVPVTPNTKYFYSASRKYSQQSIDKMKVTTLFKKRKYNMDMYSQPLLNTLLKHLWHQLQPNIFLSMLLQAWHTPILLCRTSQSPLGWMGSIGAQPFSDLSRDVQSSSTLGSGWATHGHWQSCPIATPLLSRLCA